MSAREKHSDEHQIGMLNRSLGVHQITADGVLALAAISDAALAFGTAVVMNAPSTPERTLAIRKIEEAAMWANKSIGMNQDEVVE